MKRLNKVCGVGGGWSSRRGYVHVVKFIGGGIMSMLQNLRGDYVHLYKNEQGDFVWGGYCLYPPLSLSLDQHTHNK